MSFSLFAAFGSSESAASPSSWADVNRLSHGCQVLYSRRTIYQYP